MSLQDLVTQLTAQFSNPQPSERWAMYRLINPVVDFANESMDLLPYFEYNQTSSHGTHQSVDIALLDKHGVSKILVEAKRADRKVSPEQIAKYLDKTDRGIVTNGYIWILCLQDKHEALRVFTDSIDIGALKKVIGFIQGSADLDAKPNSVKDVYINTVKPKRIVNKAKISRPTHPVEVTNTSEEFLTFINSVDGRPDNELALLMSIEYFLKTSSSPENLNIETRKTRVSFFDDRLPRNERRMARIELHKSQPDILVRTWLVEKHSVLASIAQPTIHDKGPHMRRFRLSSKNQSEEFGRKLMSILQHEALKSAK
jgi:hypothetical protein